MEFQELVEQVLIEQDYVRLANIDTEARPTHRVRSGLRPIRTLPLAICWIGLAAAACSQSENPSTLDAEQEFASAEELEGDFQEMFEVDFDKEIAIQDAIADCMIDLGFDYVPFVDPNLSTELVKTRSPATDSLEYSAERYHAERSGASRTSADPNEDILARLEHEDPLTAEAYRRTLWGTSDGLSFDRPEGGISSLDLSRDALGCASYSALRSNGGAEGLNRIYAMIDLQSELEDRIISDHRYVTEMQRIERCAAESGGESLYAEFEALFTDVEESIFDLDDPEARKAQYERARKAEVAHSDLVARCEEESEIEEIEDSLAAEYYNEVLAWYNTEGPGS